MRGVQDLADGQHVAAPHPDQGHLLRTTVTLGGARAGYPRLGKGARRWNRGTGRRAQRGVESVFGAGDFVWVDPDEFRFAEPRKQIATAVESYGGRLLMRGASIEATFTKSVEVIGRRVRQPKCMRN